LRHNSEFDESQPINRVTPRIKELLEMNKIKVAGTKYDEKTERNVETLEIN